MAVRKDIVAFIHDAECFDKELDSAITTLLVLTSLVAGIGLLCTLIVTFA